MFFKHNLKIYTFKNVALYNYKGFLTHFVGFKNCWLFLLHTLLFGIIFLNLLPGGFVQDIVSVDHFFSSFHMFEYAYSHGFIFGKDIIDNVGPYGYLHYPYIFAGGTFWAKMIWFVMISGIYTYYAILLSQDIKTPLEKFLFLFAMVFFPMINKFPWYTFEILPRLALLFSGLYLLKRPDEKHSLHYSLHIIFNGIFYGLMLLEKASNVYFLVLIITVLSLNWITIRKYQCILYLTITFFISTCFFWMFAGQKFVDFPVYFKSMHLFIDSYENVLNMDMPRNLLRHALVCCLFMGLPLLFRVAISIFISRSWKDFLLSVLVSALVFLSWKHGMLRSVSSYGTFLYLAPCIMALVCFLPIIGVEIVKVKMSISKLLLKKSHYLFCIYFMIFIGVFWSYMKRYEIDLKLDRNVMTEFHDRFESLLTYKPKEKFISLNKKYKTLKLNNEFPLALKNKIGNKTIDEFGRTPELIFLNQLNYSPRPVPIDFIVANRALNEKNGQFYQQESSAPDFILLPDFNLHLMDTLAYLRILFNYHTLNQFQDWLILEKNPTWKTVHLESLLQQQKMMNEWIFLDKLQPLFIWVQINQQLSILGKLKKFLYKPDTLRLEVLLMNGVTETYNISLSQLDAGFLIHPIIKSKNAEKCTLDHTSNIPWDTVKAFRIVVNQPKNQFLFQRQYKMTFSQIIVSTKTKKHVVLSLEQAQKQINFLRKNICISNPFV